MKIKTQSLSYLIVGLVFGFAFSLLNAENKVKVVDWSPHAKVECRMNLGPTGAAAWMRGENFEVMKVDPGSPADGILKTGDLIVGVDETDFTLDTDSRMIFGNAIGKAEAKDGKLALKIRRDGQEKNVTIPLPAIGPYAKTWPFNCPKSQLILHKACQRLEDLQLPNGDIVTDGGFGTFTSGLLLLAAGEPRFMDAALRAVYATDKKDLKKISYANWALGYGGILLAEYYLLTGDKTVLPRLQDVVDTLAKGQMNCGSWGHNNPSGGYGALNQPGAACAIAMTLAKECGLKVDENSLKKAVKFYSQFAELGAVPYGDHKPNPRAPDDNGKSSIAAILCSLYPELKKEAEAFANSIAVSYWLREEGHTGGLFSIIWGPLACDLTDDEAFRKFMDYQKWFYNLSRCWNGSLKMLPYFEALNRFDNCTYIGTDGKFTTGGMGLVYALPHRKLRILGAPRSIFGAKLPDDFLAARNAFQERDWKAFDAAMKQLQSRSGMTEEENRWFKQLKEAKKMLDATAEKTIPSIYNNIKEGDSFLAEKQYLALKRFLGDKDERIVPLDKKFEEGTVKWHIKEGTRYYEGLEKLEVMSFITWVPYGVKVRESMEGLGSIRPSFWVNLLPVTDEKSDKVETKKENGLFTINRKFNLENTDYKELRLLIRSPRKSNIHVKLNDVPVARIVRGQRGGYAKIKLDKNALKLLRKGSNEIYLTATSLGAGKNKLDFGLDAVPIEQPLAKTPEKTNERFAENHVPATLKKVMDQAIGNFSKMQLELKSSPSIPEPYYIRQSKQRFAAAINKACDELTEKELVEALASPIPYWRYLATQALVRKGEKGLKFAMAGLKDKNWRVRSASCDIINQIYQPPRNKDENKKIPAKAPGLLTSVTNLLNDENPWVRCRAAAALSSIGQNNKQVSNALAQAAGDPNEWVRIEVISTLNRIGKDPEVIKKAAVASMQTPSTSFSPTNSTIRLLNKNNIKDKSLLNALKLLVDNPGEGMGANGFCNVLKLMAEIDKDGGQAIPALIKVSAGGYKYDRLRGNPRKTAIELLGEYGPKATAAIDILKELTKETDDKKKNGYIEPAKAALEKIQK